MELKELNKVLRNKAIKSGLCFDWQQNVWKEDLDYAGLLAIYKRGLDFSVKNHWLDYDFIKEVFPAEELHKACVYIYEDVDLDGLSGEYVFVGCTGKVRFGDFCASTIYLFEDTHLDVSANDFAKLFVQMYDDSSCDVQRNDDAVYRLYDRRKKEG